MECKACGGKLVDDSHGLESTLVCMDCGNIGASTEAINFQVSDDTELAGTKFAPTTSSLAHKYNFYTNDKVQSGRIRHKKYVQEMRNACLTFVENDHQIMESAIKIFETFGMKLSFKKKLIVKLQMATSCLYVALNQHGVNVTPEKVRKAMQAPLPGFLKILNLLKREMNIQTPSPLSVTQTLIGCMKVMKNKRMLQLKAEKIYQFLEKLELTEGLTPKVISYTASYLACISEEKHLKVCTPFQQFCRQNSIGNFTRRLLREFRERVFILAKRLPWIDPNDINRDRFHRLIDDVLKHNGALFDLPSNTPTTHVLAKSEKSMTDRGLTENEFLCTPPTYLKQSERSLVSIGSDEPRAKRFKTASMAETLDDDDIPDSEIHEYLRNPEEVDRLIKIKTDLDQDT